MTNMRSYRKGVKLMNSGVTNSGNESKLLEKEKGRGENLFRRNTVCRVIFFAKQTKSTPLSYLRNLVPMTQGGQGEKGVIVPRLACHIFLKRSSHEIKPLYKR